MFTELIAPLDGCCSEWRHVLPSVRAGTSKHPVSSLTVKENGFYSDQNKNPEVFTTVPLLCRPAALHAAHHLPAAPQTLADAPLLLRRHSQTPLAPLISPPTAWTGIPPASPGAPHHLRQSALTPPEPSLLIHCGTGFLMPWILAPAFGPSQTA